MSQFFTALITSGSILAIVLASDLGSRRITAMRMMSSIPPAIIVIAVFARSFPMGGNDMSLQLTGIGVGVICGLIAGSLLRAHRDEADEIRTIGGIGYALIWIVLSSGQVVFSYGAEHWFSERMTRFHTDYEIGGQDVLVSSLALMSLAMVLSRTAVLLSRMRGLRAVQTGTAQVPAAGIKQSSGSDRP
ncbi:hypothetical protein [Streptomyces sp. V1I6]|uniref:hypothetical protein n=1 Tax=Streptomyces sp. V1I6 TaxID=3042273 RepID=UPI00278B1571|nr:hypothetical protein [Streptomyces sp. V1I6]MDQ0841403.1 hypothetical protein [Streptomyces sp. V1I6]